MDGWGGSRDTPPLSLGGLAVSPPAGGALEVTCWGWSTRWLDPAQAGGQAANWLLEERKKNKINKQQIRFPALLFFFPVSSVWLLAAAPHSRWAFGSRDPEPGHSSHLRGLTCPLPPPPAGFPSGLSSPSEINPHRSVCALQSRVTRGDKGDKATGGWIWSPREPERWYGLGFHSI